ncbi:MAG: hypothetical protein AB7F19_04350 [Candidatus Babeliales bacterium]
MKKKWFTYLCCINRLNLTRPAEVYTKIFSFCLPMPKDFINHLPLRQLPAYKCVMTPLYKEQIIAALTIRHINQLKHTLSARVRYKEKSQTPMQMAEERGHVAAALLLNPKALGYYKNKIINGYMQLLK